LDDFVRFAKELVMQFTESVSSLSTTKHGEVAPLLLTIKIRSQVIRIAKRNFRNGGDCLRGIVANPEVCSTFRKFLLAITLRIKNQRREK
jgi:hypothetical protein